MTDKEILLELVLTHNYGFIADKEFDCGDDCAICSENMYGTYILKSPCGHLLHRDCMLQNVILRGRCCECTYNYRKQTKQNDQEIQYEHYEKHKPHQPSQLSRSSVPIQQHGFRVHTQMLPRKPNLVIDDGYLDDIFDAYEYGFGGTA